jgi:hypothetical protein
LVAPLRARCRNGIYAGPNGSGRLDEIGFEKTVEMDDDEPHLCIVDGALRGSTPCLFSAGIVRENADDLQSGRVDEIERLRVADAAAEDEVEFAAHDTRF